MPLVFTHKTSESLNTQIWDALKKDSKKKKLLKSSQMFFTSNMERGLGKQL